MKTKIARLTLSTPRWDKTAEQLSIGGTTDAAVKLGDEWVATAPLRVVITDSKKSIVLDQTVTAGSDGRFSLAVDTNTWEGRYTITVSALAPEEFAGATFSKSSTKTVTISR